MPKAKKIRSAALESQQARHAPLGQVIDGDQMRGKYAAPIRYGRKKREAEAGEAEFLDEKTTKRILELSNQQREEIEMEEHQKIYAKHQRGEKSPAAAALDSDDEEEEEVEEFFIDEGDE